MNRQEAKELLKEYEVYKVNGKTNPNEAIQDFITIKYGKPESKIVPFTFEDAGKLIGKSIRNKGTGNLFLIVSVHQEGISTTNDVQSLEHKIGIRSFENIFMFYEFLDGSPCGKIIEE
jgi:hypothetical protein